MTARRFALGRTMPFGALLGALAGALWSASAAACQPLGPPEAPCRLEVVGEPSGEYLFVPAPQPAVGAPFMPPPAIVFLHGWRATAAAMLGADGLRAAAAEAGAALVLPQGAGQTWSYPGSPAAYRDEFRFFEALKADLVARHGVDPNRILLAGFSMGASMAWSLGCWQGDLWQGVVAFAGAFWTPLPLDCPRPAALLLHTHGLADGVVPIVGRPIGERFAQGDVWASVAALRNGRGLTAEPETVDARGFACRSWRAETAAAAPRFVEICTHDGGHIWRAAWITAALARIAELGR